MLKKFRQLNDSHGELLISLVRQNIHGAADVPSTFEPLRIVRVDSLGHEDDFVWIVNGFKHKPRPGDLMLFSSIDMRMPVVRNIPSDVMITVISLAPRVFVDDTGLIELFYTKDSAHRLIRAGTIAEADREFRLLISELSREDCIESAVLCRAKLLLFELCRGLGFSPGSSVSGTHIGEITAYIGRHFTEKLTLSGAAKALGISPSLLSKEMNIRLGISFPEYVRRLRVNNVINLLSGHEIGVMEAAFDSGFTSMQGFYKTFREITGAAPREMLKSGENIAKE